MNNQLKTGLTKSVQKTMKSNNTTLQFGIGALTDLFSTPTLTALMIESAVQLADPLLPRGYVTVGRTLQLTHLQPTVLGMTVTIKAELKEIEGKKLGFEMTAYDELGEIGKGWHERIIVNYGTFMEKVEQRCQSLQEKIK